MSESESYEKNPRTSGPSMSAVRMSTFIASQLSHCSQVPRMICQRGRCLTGWQRAPLRKRRNVWEIAGGSMHFTSHSLSYNMPTWVRDRSIHERDRKTWEGTQGDACKVKTARRRWMGGRTSPWTNERWREVGNWWNWNIVNGEQVWRESDDSARPLLHHLDIHNMNVLVRI